MHSILRRSFTICLLLLTLIPAISNGAAFNLDSLLTKSIGGRAAMRRLAGATGYMLAGRVDLYGQKGKFLEYVRPPDKMFLGLTFEGYALTQGYDGTTAWQSDLNGRSTIMTGFERREMIKTLYFESYSHLFADRVKGTRNYEGIVTRSDTAYHQVAFVPAGCDTVRLLFDTATGLPRLKLSDLDNTPTITTFGDFRTIDGILVPCYSKIWGIETPIVGEFWTDTVSFTHPVPDSVFQMPGSSTPDFFFPGESAQVSLPFEYRMGHIYIAARVNGVKKGTFILDSGCSATIFHNGFIESLRLPPSGSMPAKGVGGFESVDLLRTDSLQIGGVSLYRQVCGSSDLSLIGHGDSLPFGGILGYDLLSHFPILIDYRSHMITLFNPGKFNPPAGGTEVPFTLTMQVPTVHASIRGAEGNFIVDLGNAYGLLIHDNFARKNNLATLLSADTSEADALNGVGGGVSGAIAHLDTLKVGNFAMTSLPVILSDASQGMTGSSAIDGNIGNEILERYRVLFDYARQRLIFY